MFTGLVQHVGVVREVHGHDAGMRLVVDPCQWDHEPAAGDSIAVAGCCLTLLGPDSTADAAEGRMEASGPREFAFDVIAQTLAVTTLGSMQAGTLVNLEAAASMSAKLDGHVVQGHVDAIGTVLHCSEDAQTGVRLRVEVDARTLDLCVAQGSIAIDGVSLTIAALGETWLEVALIPTTLERTTLGDLQASARVNIETDVLARHVARLLERRGG